MTSPLRVHIASHIAKRLREEALDVPLDELDAWCEAKLAEKRAKHWKKPQALMRKLRPYCLHKRTRGRGQCGAKQAWNKKTNEAVDGYCMKHSPSYIPDDKKPSD